MARGKALTVKECEKKRTARGRISDGTVPGLYLSFTATGAKSWTFVWQRGGKFREMGLGSYDAVDLAAARATAFELRKIVKAGGDPLAARELVAHKRQTFGDAADTYIESIASAFRNAKHRDQWRMTLGESYCASIRPVPVDEVSTAHVAAVLKPIWEKVPETASRLRGRIERVLDAAKVNGHRAGENPARWHGHLDKILNEPRKLTRGHHAALPYAHLPAFMKRLRSAKGVAAKALELAILTAARSGEVRLAQWGEFDLEAGVWTVPAERMKMRREHRVPLSAPAIALLKAIRNPQGATERLPDPDAAELVFPSAKLQRPLSDMTLSAVLRRMKVEVTVHGFRSSFRDWCAEETDHPREVAEAALAHAVGDATERAYRRGDALEKRRRLMDDWAKYIG